MNQRLLEGDVLEAGPDPEVEVLRAETRQLRRELADAQRETDRAREDAARALSMLRRQLSPLYRALQAVFGELDAACVGDEPLAATPSGAAPVRSDRERTVWEAWKQKLGVGPAKVIDALLLHGELSTQQLAIATGYHRNTVPQYVSALYRAGLINKNGGRFSLKHL